MPRVVVPVTQTVRAGVKVADEVSGDAVNNHYYNNSGKTLLLARNSNGSATARTVTVVTSSTVDEQAVADRAIVIPAGETWVLGPYDVVNYGAQVSVNVDNAELKLRAVEPGS